MFEDFFSGLMDPSFATTAANTLDPSALLSQLGMGATMAPNNAGAFGGAPNFWAAPTGATGASNMDNPWMFINPQQQGAETAKPVPKLNLTPQDLAALQGLQQKPAEQRMAPAVSPPAPGKGGAFSPYSVGPAINPNSLSLSKLINGR